ncbi:contractile injection system protein, VgrG/Pvc8 family [Sporomusa sphaeroides DSM 2875]|uniref:phage late control D family protein n=1 Tax=Sporomusa sphaeroides TaxID=47679 RepID=UPI002030B4A2|nr:contractile injection system protein, VgrG/Pvc8 family [Sporomusa sphaeroides]MCM0759613.1 contractile injection system protein, VgrG/Pvc8 family [Sporomusa sphaeroides DSM 2875]
MKARRAYLKLLYDNKDISADLAPYLLSWSYSDHASGKADDLQISLEDREGLWMGDWLPDKGATLKAILVTEHWSEQGKTEELPLGTFEIDAIDGKSSPSSVTIKALSIPESASLRGEEKTRSWEKVKLSTIARDIATKAGLTLFYDTDDDPEEDRVEQTEQSDLAFLQQRCEDAGLSLKVSDQQIVIFDEEKYEAMEPVLTIKRGQSHILDHSFSTTTRDVYSACRVEYHDPKGKKSISHTYRAPNKPATGKTLVINQRVKSIAKAEKLARKKLRKQNKGETKMSFSLLGDIRLLAARTVMVEGYGKFDGKYFIEEATHAGAGYTVKIDLRRVLEGY